MTDPQEPQIVPPTDNEHPPSMPQGEEDGGSVFAGKDIVNDDDASVVTNKGAERDSSGSLTLRPQVPEQVQLDVFKINVFQFAAFPSGTTGTQNHFAAPYALLMESEEALVEYIQNFSDHVHITRVMINNYGPGSFTAASTFTLENFAARNSLSLCLPPTSNAQSYCQRLINHFTRKNVDIVSHTIQGPIHQDGAAFEIGNLVTVRPTRPIRPSPQKPTEILDKSEAPDKFLQQLVLKKMPDDEIVESYANGGLERLLTSLSSLFQSSIGLEKLKSVNKTELASALKRSNKFALYGIHSQSNNQNSQSNDLVALLCSGHAMKHAASRWDTIMEGIGFPCKVSIADGFDDTKETVFDIRLPSLMQENTRSLLELILNKFSGGYASITAKDPGQMDGGTVELPIDFGALESILYLDLEKIFITEDQQLALPSKVCYLKIHLCELEGGGKTLHNAVRAVMQQDVIPPGAMVKLALEGSLPFNNPSFLSLLRTVSDTPGNRRIRIEMDEGCIMEAIASNANDEGALCKLLSTGIKTNFSTFRFLRIPVHRLVNTANRNALLEFLSSVLRNAGRRSMDLFASGVCPITFARAYFLFSEENEVCFDFLSRLREKLGLKSQNMEYLLALTRVVETSGMVLPNLSPALRDDEFLVMTAIKQARGALLQFASPRLQGDRTFALGAIKEYWANAAFISESLMDDRDFIQEAAKMEGLILGFIDEDWKSDVGVVEVSLRQNGMSLSAAADALQSDMRLVEIACSQNGNAFDFAHESLKRDLGLLTTAVQNIRYGVNFDWQSVFNKYHKQYILPILFRLISLESAQISVGEMSSFAEQVWKRSCREKIWIVDMLVHGDDLVRQTILQYSDIPIDFEQANGLIKAAPLLAALQIRGLLSWRSLLEQEGEVAVAMDTS